MSKVSRQQAFAIRAQQFFQDNIQWMIASLILAFGLWIIAVMQNDPIDQRQFPGRIGIQYNLAEDMVITDAPNIETALVTIRAPESVLNDLRIDQIRVEADLEELDDGTHTIRLTAELDDGLRGDIVRIDPPTVEISQDRLVAQRLPLRVIVTQEPPSGYSYPAPSCALTEVTANGPQSSLVNATAVVRLDLSDTRNPVTITAPIVPVNEAGRLLSNVTVETTEVECTVEVAQREGIFELSVVPVIEGTPPAGYIYRGFSSPRPATVTVTGNNFVIRNLNGVISTQPIDISEATADFEEVVGIDLPAGVRLSPETQSVVVTIQIGTIPGTAQFAGVPVQVEGLSANLEADILPNTVTVLVVAPQPNLDELTAEDIQVVVNADDLAAGSYQLTATASILVSEIDATAEITVQPPELSVTLRDITPNE